jgi:Cysteine-rich secretory protein family
MRRFTGLAFCLFALAFGSVAGPLAAEAGTVSSSPTSIAEQYLFNAANAERVQRGLKALRWDGQLWLAATNHAREMAARASISHQYPGEADLGGRGKMAGARFSLISENVAEAPTAVNIHTAWMNSEGHRANLLDPALDSVGISVMRRDGQLYAVEDFERSVDVLSFEDQEITVGELLRRSSSVEVLRTTADARRTCEMGSGYAGATQPWFVMRFTAGDLDKLPATLRERLASGKYRHAIVGACSLDDDEPFSAFKIAVLLFR